MEIRFLTRNNEKIKEAKIIFAELKGIELIAYDKEIKEIQTEDLEELVRDKTVRAFKKIGRRLFVEHTGLFIEGLNGLPGGLTSVFWDKYKAQPEDFITLINRLQNRNVIAKTVIGYCDEQQILLFDGETHGVVPDRPRGKRDFGWDCVFIPNGDNNPCALSFAELGEHKHTFSMRRKALEKFANHLKSTLI